MVTIYLATGQSFQVPNTEAAHVDKFPNSTVTALVCTDLGGQPVAYFKLTEILGYSVGPEHLASMTPARRRRTESGGGRR